MKIAKKRIVKIARMMNSRPVIGFGSRVVTVWGRYTEFKRYGD